MIAACFAWCTEKFQVFACGERFAFECYFIPMLWSAWWLYVVNYLVQTTKIISCEENIIQKCLYFHECCNRRYLHWNEQSSSHSNCTIVSTNNSLVILCVVKMSEMLPFIISVNDSLAYIKKKFRHILNLCIYLFQNWNFISQWRTSKSSQFMVLVIFQVNISNILWFQHLKFFSV